MTSQTTYKYMVYNAAELLAKLRILTLVGKDDENLEWIGTDDQWRKLHYEVESIYRDWELSTNF